MAISIKQYAEALQLAVQETKSEDHDMVVENLISVMRDNGDLEKYEAVVSAFEELQSAGAEVKEAEVTFAREATQNKRILDELNEIVGSNVEIRAKVDDSLVGGVVLRVDDELIDASVKGQLDRIKKDLSS